MGFTDNASYSQTLTSSAMGPVSAPEKIQLQPGNDRPTAERI